MHQMRRIEEIRSTMYEDEEAAAAVRAAARELEASVPVGEILAALVAKDATVRLLGAAAEAPERLQRPWLTLAAAGAPSARRALAWRASELLAPAELVEVLLEHASRPQAECRRRAARRDGEEGAAWRLLSHLRRRELVGLMRGRPALACPHRRALAGARRAGRTFETAPVAAGAC